MHYNFPHRTRFYRAKKKFLKGVNVKQLETTKNANNLLVEANKYCYGGNKEKIVTQMLIVNLGIGTSALELELELEMILLASLFRVP